jgi:mutual gliding-motility protein MglA
VADSQVERLDANIERCTTCATTSRNTGSTSARYPFVIQYNKRDLPNICSVRELEENLNPGGVPFFEAVGSRGIGVFDTLRCVSNLVIESLS